MVSQSFPCSICRLSEADYWPLMNNPLPLFHLPVWHYVFYTIYSVVDFHWYFYLSLFKHLILCEFCFHILNWLPPLIQIFVSCWAYSASLLCGNTTVFIIVSSLFGSSFRFFSLGIVTIQFKFFGKGIFLFLFFLVCVCAHMCLCVFVCVCIYVSFLAGTCTSEVVCWFSHFFL